MDGLPSIGAAPSRIGRFSAIGKPNSYLSLAKEGLCKRLGQFLVPLGAGAVAAPFGSSAIFVGLASLIASAGVISVATLDDEIA